MNEHQRCEKCLEPTKYPVGFWDGPGDGGLMYGCGSQSCQLAINRREAAAENQRHREQARAANKDAGIDTAEIKALYLQKGLTLNRVSQAVRIPTSKLSGLMNEREPFPLELYQRITDFLNTLPDKRKD